MAEPHLTANSFAMLPKPTIRTVLPNSVCPRGTPSWRCRMLQATAHWQQTHDPLRTQATDLLNGALHRSRTPATAASTQQQQLQKLPPLRVDPPVSHGVVVAQRGQREEQGVLRAADGIAGDGRGDVAHPNSQLCSLHSYEVHACLFYVEQGRRDAGRRAAEQAGWGARWAWSMIPCRHQPAYRWDVNAFHTHTVLDNQLQPLSRAQQLQFNASEAGRGCVSAIVGGCCTVALRAAACRQAWMVLQRAKSKEPYLPGHPGAP